MAPIVKLHPYQERAVAELLEHENRALFVDMGLGKTLMVLTTFDTLQDELAIHRALVIAPLATCYATWPDEIRKWYPHLRVHNLHAKPDTRAEADLYLINPAGLPRLFGRPVFAETRNGTKRRVWQDGLWQHWTGRPEMLIVDESTAFKNTQSGRSKTLKRVLGDFQRRVIMTGTPAPNGLMDLFGQMLILDHGETLGDKITHFREQYFKGVEIGVRGKKFMKYEAAEGAFDVVQELIKPMVTALEADDWIQLPDKVYVEVPVILPKPVLDLYHGAKEGVVLETGQPLFATGGAAAKLKQIANGRAYVGDPLSIEREVAVIHEHKMQALDELIEQVGRPMLIAYEYTCDGDALVARLKAPIINGKTKPKDRAELIAKWNTGKLPALIVQPQAASHGLNLQHGGHDIVWYTPCWDLEVYLQFNGRLARQGQKEKQVFIYHLVARGTVDERVVTVLADKDANQAALMAALKSEIDS